MAETPTELPSMAEEEEEEEETVKALTFHQPQQVISPFVEIACKSSGKVRRFSAGTEAGFALQCMNEKLASGVPLGSFIEAVKEGEEPITFGPNSVLVDYGDGWKLQTAVKEDIEGQKILEERKEFPDVVIEPVRDDVQSATDLDLHIAHPQHEENRSITSVLVSDIETQSESLDYTDPFTTDMVFSSRDELINWTRGVGRSVGMVVVIKKSEFGVSGRTSRIYFACERFGKRREYKRAPTCTTTRRRVSKRCECPFLLRGIKLPKDDEWKVKVECGHHNHPLSRHLQGSSVAGKLTPEEKEFVIQMLKAGIQAKEILKALKEKDDRNESTIRTIYNAQAKWRLEEAQNESIVYGPKEILRLEVGPARSQCNSC